MQEENLPRLISSNRIKALFSEEGDLLYLELDGKTYEGLGYFAPIPVFELKGLKLSEIPEDVYIEPVKRIKDGVIQGLSLGEVFSYSVRLSKGIAEIEVLGWTTEWDRAISAIAYYKALVSVVRELTNADIVNGYDVETEDKWFSLSFSLRIPDDLTVHKTLALIKKIAWEIEAEVEYRAALLAFKEAKRRLASLWKPEEKVSERVKKLLISI
ncbi:MAG: hypothetical protein QXY49_04245 [Thermofilaceae archaeon]